MSELIERISQAPAEELESLLQAVLSRYAELFPDWEVTTVSFQKDGDRNAQIDQFIALLNKLKTS